jgi:hypothetical protein
MRIFREKRIQDKLRNYRSSVDSEEIWLGVQAGLAARRRKRRLLWLWFFSGLMIILGGLAVYTLFPFSTSNPSPTPIAESPSVEKGPGSLFQLNPVEKGEVMQTSSPKDQIPVPTPPSITEARTEKPGLPFTDDFSNDPFYVEDLSMSPTLPGPILEEKERLIKAEKVSAISPLPSLSVEIPDRKVDMPFKNPILARKRTSFPLGIYLNTGVILGSGDEQINIQGAEIQRQADIRAGLHIVLPHSSGWFIRAGLEYSRHANRLQFNGRYTRFDSTNYAVNTRVFLQSQGDTLFDSGIAMKQQTIRARYSINNRLERIDLPLIVGYQLTANRFSYGVEAGLLLHLQHTLKGMHFDPEGVPTPIAQSGGKSFLKIPKWSYHLGLSGQYALRPGLFLRGNAFLQQSAPFQYSVRESSTGYRPFQGSHQRWGIDLGIILFTH